MGEPTNRAVESNFCEDIKMEVDQCESNISYQEDCDCVNVDSSALVQSQLQLPVSNHLESEPKDVCDSDIENQEETESNMETEINMCVMTSTISLSEVNPADAANTQINATEAEANATDTTAIATESNAVATDTNRLATEATAIATESNAIATDTNAIVTEANAIATELDTIVTDINAIATEGNMETGINLCVIASTTSLSEVNSADAAETQINATEAEANATDTNGIAVEVNAIATESNAIVTDINAITTESNMETGINLCVIASTTSFSEVNSTDAAETQINATQAEANATYTNAIVTESNAVVTDPNEIETEEIAIATEPNAIATDTNAIATEANTIPTESNAIVTDINAIATEAIASESNASVTDINVIATESNMETGINLCVIASTTSLSEVNSADAAETQINTTEAGANATDTTAIATESNAVVTDTNRLATEATAIATESNAIATESNAIVTNINAIATEPNAIVTDINAIATEPNAIVTDINAIATESNLETGVNLCVIASTTSLSGVNSADATESQINATEAEANATDTNAIATEATAIATESNAIATDTNIITTEAIATESNTITTEAIATESNAITTEAIATESNAIVTDINAIATEANAIATESNAIVTDTNAFVTESNAVATDTNAVATDTYAVAIDTNAVVTEENAMATGINAIVTEADAIATDTNAVATDIDAVTIETNAIVPDINAVGTEANAIATDTNTIAIDTNAIAAEASVNLEVIDYEFVDMSIDEFIFEEKGNMCKVEVDSESPLSSGDDFDYKEEALSCESQDDLSTEPNETINEVKPEPIRVSVIKRHNLQINKVHEFSEVLVKKENSYGVQINTNSTNVSSLDKSRKEIDDDTCKGFVRSQIYCNRDSFQKCVDKVEVPRIASVITTNTPILEIKNSGNIETCGQNEKIISCKVEKNPEEINSLDNNEPNPYDYSCDNKEIVEKRITRSQSIFDSPLRNVMQYESSEDDNSVGSTNQRKYNATYSRESKVFECTLCHYQTLRIFFLKRHLFVEHKENDFRLEEFRDLARVESDNFEEFTSKNVFECLHCEYRTESKTDLKEHCTMEHERVKKGRTIHKCTLCSYKANSKVVLREHLNGKHNLLKKHFRCTLCSFQTKWRQSICMHYRVTHELEVPPKSLFPQDYIGSSSKISNKGGVSKMPIRSLDEQKTNVFERKKLFKCSDCSFVSKRWKTLYKHKLVIHNKETKEIIETSAIVKEEPDRSIENENLFKCSDCPFVTKLYESLYRHRALEHSIQSQQATETQKPMDQTEKQINETRIDEKQTREKQKSLVRGRNRHKCKVCSYTSKWEANLRRHVQIKHAALLKIFKCPACSFASKWKHGYNLHVNRYHSDSPDLYKLFKCTSCSFTSRWKQGLNHHIKSFHTNASSMVVKCKTKLTLPTPFRSGGDGYKLFSCLFCPFHSTRKQSYNFHMKKCHPNSSSKTLTYKMKFKIDSSFKSSKKHVREFSCPDCTFKTKWKQSLDHHCKLQHKSVVPSSRNVTETQTVPAESKVDPKLIKIDDKFCCELCQFKTKWRSSMYEHYKRIHQTILRVPKKRRVMKPKTDNFKFKSLNNWHRCISCNFKTKYINNLKRHFYSQHEDESDGGSGKFERDPPKSKSGIDYNDRLNKVDNHRNSNIREDSNSPFNPGDNSNSDTDDKGHLSNKVNETSSDKGKTVPKENSYPCQSCEFVTKYESSLKRHVFSHHEKPDRIEQLSQTLEPSTKTAELPNKIDEPSSSKSDEFLKCSLCDFTSKWKHILHRHINQSHNNADEPSPDSGVQFLKCTLCSFTSVWRHILHRHIKQAHKNPPVKPSLDGGAELLKCTFCSYTSIYRHILNRHMKQTHKNPRVKTSPGGGVELLKCTFCSFTSKWRHLLHRHINRTHKNPPVEASRGGSVELLKCTSCNFTSKWKHILHRHINRIHKNPRVETTPGGSVELFKCTLCSFTTKWKHILYRHTNQVHKNPVKASPGGGVELLKCRLCSYTSKWKHVLYQHIKQAHKNPPAEASPGGSVELLKCTLCSFTSKWRHLLHRHINQKHKNPRVETTPGGSAELFKCSLCSFSSKWKNVLQRHIKVIHKVLPLRVSFKCTICDFSTKLKHALNNHMKNMHEDIPEIKCPFCGFTTTFKGVMLQHINEVHGQT